MLLRYGLLVNRQARGRTDLLPRCGGKRMMADQAKESCPLCGWDAKRAGVPRRDASEVDCPRCGRFIITRILMLSSVLDTDRTLLPYLSAHTRQANVQGA